MKPILLFNFLLLIAIFDCNSISAQFPYRETFQNTSAPGLVVSGASKLTAAAGTDPAGAGYLRLNENITNSIGYMYGQDSFPSNYGLSINFEFFCWKTGATATNQADGMTFFLFDAAVNAFRPGGTGGSLGYAQYYTTPGIAKGYIGISIDEFGNFSSATDGNKNGGPGQQRGSIAIRGPGNGKALTDYVYQTGVIASDPAYNAGFAGFTQRYPDSTQANYRRMKIIMTPGSSLGSTIGYKVTVIMYKGGSPVTPVTLINNFDYPFIAPAKLQFGLAASTGSITNYHEIRNMQIDVAGASSLLAATAVNDAGAAVCQGQQAIMDVTANDISNNTGGSINKAAVDLDPLTIGKQVVYTDPLKGTFAVDSNGIVTFSPLTGFAGTASASYTVRDTYGAVSAAASITVTASSTTGPQLVLSDPPAACIPSVVDITSALLKTTTTPGAVYSYYSSLADANNNSNNINLIANVIAIPATYYIRAALSGCATVKPIIVRLSPLPTTANAGADQSFCASTGNQSTTLLATNPDAGDGVWTMLSGPSGAAITYPLAATSPLALTQTGVYTFRYTVSIPGCLVSGDDMQISVGNTTANAGLDQVLSSANQVTLAGNAAITGSGKWTVVSSPAGSTININQNSNPVSIVQVNRAGDYTFRWTMTNGSCTNNDAVLVSVLSLLPVNLINFTGQQTAGGISLQWTTASESSNRFFEVQRSETGNGFTTIATVPGHGNTNSTNTYGLTDTTTLLKGTSVFYRLKQVDADGAFSYSPVVKISVQGSLAFTVSPNPAKGYCNITIPGNINGNISIKIYTAGGQLLQQISTASRAGDNRQVAVSLEGIVPGILIVQITNGSQAWQTRIVKER